MPRRGARSRARTMVVLVTVSLLGALCVVRAPMAAAAGTVLFQNAFNNRTVSGGTGTVTVPVTPSGTNAACLTVSGNSATLPLLSCPGAADWQGTGALRLTPATPDKIGGVYGQVPAPTVAGLDITFTAYQWGGDAADGLSFVLAAADPQNPAPPARTGPPGGSLGYTPFAGAAGLPYGYLGVGLDVYGNFSSNEYTGSGCTNPTTITTRVPGAVVVRGPGSGTAGYCGLTSTYTGTSGSLVTLRGSSRSNSAVPVQVLVNPTASSYTSPTGVSVLARTYKVVATPVGQSTRTLSGPLPAVPASLIPSTTWLDANGVPKQLAFGFIASTGGQTDTHEISNAKVTTFNPVPQLGVSTTSYAATTSQPGNPVNYRVTASVLTGTAETKPITVTQTVPAGVAPVGAYGSGWVCQAPVGQTVTCTTSGSSFAAGTSLPVLTVVAITTAANVSTALIQGGSPARVASLDANPATDTSTTIGVRPTAPSGVTVTPAVGPVAGGGTVTVGGANITAATAIEIGTTAEQQAGIPVVLLPCPGAAAPGCFTVSGSTLVISSMPGRSTIGSVTVTVVTLGVAAAANYVYVDRPARPATPTAVAGITSATVTWVVPADNGSSITAYVVTPYLGGVAQAPRSFDTTTTSRTLTGLTAGGTYTFTVSAVNSIGTSTASLASSSVVPYTVPGAPVITAASAGSLSATLSWTAPGTGGSAITSYRVTPYVAGVAQTPQSFAGSATTALVTGLTAATNYTFTVAAVNIAGTGPESAPSSTVAPNRSPSLSFPAPPSGQAGVAYSRLLAVTDGTSPFTWSISAGAMPAGLTLNATTGLLSGTPTAAGTFSFTVRVVDASNQTATKAVTLVIATAPTTTFTPAAGEVGVAYSQQATVSGGTGPFAWTVSAGSLPAGVTLNAATGLVSGTPTASGNFAVTISATDSFNQVASRTATVVIAARPAFGVAAPPNAQVGVAYSTTFTVTGGTAPLQWSIPAGSPPPGLTFNTSTGVLSGTPTTQGSYAFTVAVTDSFNQTTSRAVTLVVTSGPLVITKTANVSSAVAGGTVAYTVRIVNTGTIAFSGVTLSDPLTGVLDDAAYNNNATTTSGTLSYAEPTLGWTGNVPASGSVTITYSVTVQNPVVGNKVLANTVASPTLGTNCAAGSDDSRCTATVTVPGLTMTKTADRATTTPGGVVRFTIVVTNTGQTPYPTATLTDGIAGVLDDATYNNNATTTAGNLSYTSPSLTWTGSLAVGASVTITYSVTVANPDEGDRSLTGTVVSPSAGSPCPSGNPAAQCTATVQVLVPALSITNTADVTVTTPGGVVAYTVTLANTGQTAYTATSVSIAVGGALDDAVLVGSLLASAGTVTYNPATTAVVWTGNLAVGTVVTITASVRVLDPYPGDKTLITEATSSAGGSTCLPGGSSPACTSTVQIRVPALTIATSADVSETTPGSLVRYTVSATNTGQTDYATASLSVALTGSLDDASYNSNVTTTAGTVAVGDSVLTWSGPLLIGATATIAYSVTVDDPVEGDLTLRTTVSSTTAGNNCAAASTDPRCASSVNVLVPDLAITTELSPSTATPNDVVTLVGTVTNTGQTPYVDLDITLNLDGALDDADYNYDVAITAGDLVTNPDGTVSWVLDLAAGESASGTLTMTVRSPASGDRALEVISVANAPGSNCQVGSAAQECRDTVTILVPGLTMTKSADTSTASPGETVGYTVTVVNDGETTYPDARFTDDLARVLTDATYSGGATATSGTLAYAAPVLSWQGALAPGASATISYSVTVLDPDPGDKTMINTVVSPSAGTNCVVGGADPRCTAVVSVRVPALTIVTGANASTTTPGAALTYTITATNVGATVFTGATVTNALAGALDDADYNTDASATIGAVAVTGSTLTWTGDLAIGAAVTITYSVVVRAADTGDDLVTTTVTSAAPGNNCAVGNEDDRCSSTVAVARLILSQSPDEFTTIPGATVRLTATYVNTGRVPYTGISVMSPRADTADDTIPTGDQTATSGSISRTADFLVWTGDVPVGETVTVLHTLTVKDPDPGNRLITATLQSTAPGNNCPVEAPAPLCTFAVPVLVPQLTITKTADRPATAPGGSVAYTITVRNTGETAYPTAALTDSLTGLLDDATYNDDATTTTGTVTYNSAALSWSGALDVGDEAVITYTVTTRNPAPGDKTMVNSVDSPTVGTTCPPGSGNPACRLTTVVLTPGLTLVKTADVPNATLGTTVTYSVEVWNSGQTSQPAAAFTDSLAGVLDDATYNPADTSATAGTVSYADGVLSWSGALAPGDRATVTYTTTINAPSTGDRLMATPVVSTTTGNNCATDSTDPRCTAAVFITNEVSLSFTKTADRPAAAAGDVVTYTVTVTNSSVSPVAANLTDPLAGILDDAVYNDDASAGTGTVTYDQPNLTWTGTVLAASTVTMTYSVTVGPAAAGDGILLGTISSTSLPASNNCLADSEDPRCASRVTIASLRIEQSYVQTTTTPGAVVRLNATFTNTGQTPYTGITIYSLSAGTTDDANPTGDQVASSGSLILSATAITWTGDIPVGGTVTVTGTLTVKTSLLGDRLITGTLVSTALGTNCPPGGADSRCVAALPVLIAGLTITTFADTTWITPGGTVEYTIAIVNSGETPYTAVTVAETLEGLLDDADYNDDAETSGGVLSFDSPTLTWTGDLAVGATVTITYSVTTNDPATGDREMASAVSSDALGNNCPPANPAAGCAARVTVLTPVLAIASSVSSPTTVPGATVTYTLTVGNAGQTTYAAAQVVVPLAGILDDADYNADATATAGAVSLTGQTLTWTGPLAPAATATITYTVTVDQPVTGDLRLTQTVTSADQGSTCPVDGPDPLCDTDVPIAGLQILSGVDVTTAIPTSVVNHTATFTNTGQVPYVGLVLNNAFLGSIDDASYNGDAATTAGDLFLSPTGQIVWTGDLAVGETVTVTGSLTVNNPDLGDRLLTTIATTDAVASNCPTAAPGPGCATSVPVLIPGLTIGKTASTATTTPGSTVGYSITVTNSGQAPYLAATVRDSFVGVVADATYQDDAEADRGSVSVTGERLTWTGDLAVGQTAVISYSVLVRDPALGGKLMVNSATSDEIGSTCPTGGVAAPECRTFVSVLVPVLDIAIAADRTTTVPGGTVGYTLTVRNSGQTDYPSATVTTQLAGVLDDATYVGDATATSGVVTFTDQVLSWTGDLAGGATATITYRVTVTDPPVGNQELVTTATSAAAGSTCGTAPQCGNLVTVLIPGLAVSTQADTATATPGDRVTFTITIRNTGQTPYLGTVVSTSLADIVDDAVFTGEISSTSGIATYTAPVLSWTGTLTVGATATVTYSVTIRSPDPGDKALTTTVIGAAAGSSCQDGDLNPACTAAVTVLIPALTIGKSASTAITTPGGTVGYTITVANSGQTAYEGAVVSDSLAGLLPDSVYNGDAVATSGTLVYADSVLAWTGDLPIGANATITYSITVNDPDLGDKLMTNAVSSAVPGSTCPPGNALPDCVTQTRVLVPELVVTKTADTTTVVAGDTVEYTVSLTNNGETAYSPASFTDPLTGVLDDGDYAGDAVASTGTVEFLGDTLVWTGALGIGASATITYSVTTRPPTIGDLALTNTAYSSSPGSNCLTGADALCTATVTVLVPALTITKTADTSQVVAGGTVGYTISATNTGQSDYPAAAFSDALIDVLDNAVYNADAAATSGVVTYAGTTLGWTGPLSQGETVVLTYSVSVAVTVPDVSVLINRVTSDDIGSTCTTGGIDPDCATATIIAPRTISLDGLTPSFTLSGLPDSTVSTDDLVSMTVTTNSTAGYQVSVQATATTLAGLTSGNTATIPIELLRVRESGSQNFVPLSADTPVVVHRQDVPTGIGGNAVSNDFQIEIPDVPSDTYTTTLDYIVSAQ